MTYSRVDKYKELRQGLKGEAGIQRQDVKVEKETVDDDFLSFLHGEDTDDKKEEIKTPDPINMEDTLTEVKTFEQMRAESSKEIDKALKSAKVSVGKEEQYNTRMDILNKIREPEQQKIVIESMDQYTTDQFSKGMLLHQEPEIEEVIEEDKPQVKMTLLERLAMMSPKEDSQKIDELLNQEEDIEDEVIEDIVIDEDDIEANGFFEEEIQDNQVIEDDDHFDEEDDLQEDDNKVATILNIIIIVLVFILIGLFGMIIYQNFF